jgi:hypothetical protein
MAYNKFMWIDLACSAGGAAAGRWRWQGSLDLLPLDIDFELVS